jgi:hypothetical protein
MLYGEVHTSGHFRFVNFGHPPPLLFSARAQQFLEVDREGMVQFMSLGLDVPDDHPDRKRYTSMRFRKTGAECADVAELTLINPGDILFLYTDGVYDGSDEVQRYELQELMRAHCTLSAREICTAVLEYAVQRDRLSLDRGEPDLVDDKTAFLIKRKNSPDPK